MAPSPENDNAPKAPDKNDKSKCEKPSVSEISKEKDKDTKALFNLNEVDLKALLDEAISYKIPKDREGKSPLFKSLLNEAEESERIARAASAGGSELVRHCNPSAKRNNRHRRKPSSISENMMHGGSLDNLANEELYVADRHLHRTKKSVSARQREGGSLPCNVNSSSLMAYDIHFLDEARTRTAAQLKPLPLDTETVNLLEHDSVAENYQEQTQIPNELANTTKYTSKATLQVNVDDNQIQHMQDFDCDKKTFDTESLQSKMLHSKHSVYITIPNNRNLVEDKKVDENGNHQNPINKGKKKKVSNTKKVTEFKASDVAGYRGDIVYDIPKLLQFIGGSSSETSTSSGKNKSNIQKSKLYKQDTDDGNKSKKQRSHSKNKENHSDLKKSNSMGEISTSKLDEFEFNTNQDNEKVILRMNKSHGGEKPRERRSWGNVEPPPFQSLYSNASAENLETLENWVVTKPKKKSKKRRNSISSSRPQNATIESNVKHINNRAPSPDIPRGGKSTCSVPHSEKSNDSSDVDSVHSLPIDGLNNIPISYADIAKNREKLKEKKYLQEKLQSDKVPNKDNRSPQMKITATNVETTTTTTTTSTTSTDVVKCEYKMKQNLQTNQHLIITTDKHVNSSNVTNPPSLICNNNNNNNNNNNAVKSLPPPDVHNIKSFPAISTTNNSKVYNSNININNNNAVSVQTNTTNKTFNNNTNNNKNNTVSNKVKSNNNNKSVKNNVQKINNCTIQHNVVATNDIQTDLSIIQANEKDSIQFNAQMLPPDIPDVQTIEKMQFLNQQQHQQQLQNLSNSQVSTTSTTQSGLANNYQNVGQQQQQQQQKQLSKFATGNDNNLTNSANCDTSERTTTTSTKTTTTTVNNLDVRPPPVVILSGMGKNKEVSGLVFGFDINEQLLSEDICQDFIARYMAPEIYSHTSHNHDKIVNFIGTTWESAINPSNGNVEYYTEKL